MSYITPIQSVSNTLSSSATNAVKQTQFGSAYVDSLGEGVGARSQMIMSMDRLKKAIAVDAQDMIKNLGMQLSNHTLSADAAIAKFARLSEIIKSLPASHQQKIAPILENLKTHLNTFLNKTDMAQGIYKQAKAFTSKVSGIETQQAYYTTMKNMILQNPNVTKTNTSNATNTSTKTQTVDAISPTANISHPKKSSAIQASDTLHKKSSHITTDAIKALDKSQPSSKIHFAHQFQINLNSYQPIFIKV